MHKSLLITLLTSASLMSGCISHPKDSQPAALPAAPQWTLAWQEEFEQAGLPNDQSWQYEVGFIRNSELQYYTHADLDNCFIRDGKLNLVAKHETITNPDYAPQAKHKTPRYTRETAAVTSASINTLDKVAFGYGKIEIRAKLPQGQGVWPALWMMGINCAQRNWPDCGEIDIMEFVWGTPKTIYGTCHWKRNQPLPNGSIHTSTGGTITCNTLKDQWHLYTIIRTPEKIDFFFDNQKYYTFDCSKANRPDGSNPFREPMYLLINLAIGGAWGGALDPKTLPATYQVDYVRYYTPTQIDSATTTK